MEVLPNVVLLYYRKETEDQRGPGGSHVASSRGAYSHVSGNDMYPLALCRALGEVGGFGLLIHKRDRFRTVFSDFQSKPLSVILLNLV